MPEKELTRMSEPFLEDPSDIGKDGEYMKRNKGTHPAVYVATLTTAIAILFIVLYVQQKQKTSASTDLKITIGTPGVSFHRTANWVVVRGLEQLGYEVTVMDQIPHRDMYPHFTGSDGQVPTVDMVTGSDLPYNHLPFLGPTQGKAPPAGFVPTVWEVIGSVNEATDIIMAVPPSATQKSVSDLTSVSATFTKELIGLDQDTCPACVTNGNALIASDLPGFTYKSHTSTEFMSAVKALEAKNTAFAAVWYVPTYLNAQVDLVRLDGDLAPFNRSSQGKTIIRNDRKSKLTPAALKFVTSAFVGNANIVKMDTWVNVDGMTAQAAADKWIAENKETFDMFFW
jgi:ABC-type proline/glycine betaine transport system substrate-binding protein